MTIKDFFSDRLGRFVFQAVFLVAAVVFLRITGTDRDIVILLLCAGIPVFIFTQAYDYFKCRTRLKELESIMEGLDKKYLFAECVPGSKNAYERHLMELSAQAGRAMIRAVSDAQEAGRAYREYVESWVHEIKAPITAAALICHNADQETRGKLAPELAQIEAHVERALFYARAESPEKDFIIAGADLAKIVVQVIDQYRALLIQSGVRVETRNLDQTVYTDRKWVVFILGQLMQNAVRYRSGHPVVTLSADRQGQQIQLSVHDNGIGILAHELPRIFDRGFTGSNGRIRGGSTGMGLYLCRRLADCLEIDLYATSQAGEGTTVVLAFPAKN